MGMPRSIPINASMTDTLNGLLLGDGNLSYAKTRPTCNSSYRQSSISADWLAEIATTFRESGYQASIYFVKYYRCEDGHDSPIWYLYTSATAV